MTEQEIIELLQNLNVKLTDMAGHKTNGIEKIFGWNEITAICEAIKALEEIQQYRAIGTIEEFKALKEKSEPKELEEHNFQDEVHHYLCPSCRSIVSFNQNYCDECGQALET